MIGAIEEGDCALHEAHATGEVQGGVALTIAHQRVCIGLQQVLDHLVLPSQHCQVQGRLQGRGREGERERNRFVTDVFPSKALN